MSMTTATTKPVDQVHDATGIPDDPLRVLPTLNDDGSRRWIKPRPSPGRFLTRRRVVAYLLIAVFTVLPFLKMGGNPLILLNVPARRFHIFGHTFLPTDTLLLALLMVGTFVTIFFVTAMFGRVWCGWACPQTVYMEFVFRPIERLFHGTPGRAKKGPLAGPAGKFLRPVVYLLVCLWLSHTFLAYFVGVDQLRVWVTRSPFDHPVSFLIIAFVTVLMMFDFLYFREQMCLVACPYGRFQSVMLDRNSLIVGYDVNRGEPRGKPKGKASQGKDVSLAVLAGESAKAGDCVDCHMCVATCPTGIDIRKGLQMECIGCAQCIDACDAVMDKLHRPRGLIGYTTQTRLAKEKPKFIRPRVLIYPSILVVIATAFFALLLTQAPANVSVLRGFGKPYDVLPSGEISNHARVKIFNREDVARAYTVAIDAKEMSVVGEENPIIVPAGQYKTVPIQVVAPASAFGTGKAGVQVLVSTDGFSTRRVLTLMGPRPTGHVDDKHDKHGERDDQREKP
jgi:cytochrome c oxidase accessory protein FixG